MSWIKSNESKGIFFSLLIHSALLGSVLIKNDEPVKLADKQKSISIDLTTCKSEKKDEKPKQIEKQKPKKIEKPKPKPKKVEKPKPKPKPKPKKVEKPKPKEIEPLKPTPKQIHEEPVEIKEESITNEEKVDKIIKPVQDNKVQSISSQQQEFVKTNFEIIRDMVLSNVKYPSIARRMKWTGVVEMQLVVDSSGRLTEYSIVKSSGRKHLDKAAMKAVRLIASKTLPKPKYTTTIILPVSFELI